jgi:hypothetical protein
MNTIRRIQKDIRARLGDIVEAVNASLRGGCALGELESTLARLGRGGNLPHWYARLKRKGTLPNLDGKSLGSVLEMVFVSVLECRFYHKSPLVPFHINPARGIDIPDLKLGVKSPSENYNPGFPRCHCARDHRGAFAMIVSDASA